MNEVQDTTSGSLQPGQRVHHQLGGGPYTVVEVDGARTKIEDLVMRFWTRTRHLQPFHPPNNRDIEPGG